MDSSINGVHPGNAIGEAVGAKGLKVGHFVVGVHVGNEDEGEYVGSIVGKSVIDD